MATIKNLTVNPDLSITLVTDTGEILSMTAAQGGIIKEQYMLDELRCAITNILDDEIDGGYIDMSRHEFSREDFEEEVYVDFEDDITCGDYSCLSDEGETIREKISDMADYYELCPSDEDEDDEEDED